MKLTIKMLVIAALSRDPLLVAQSRGYRVKPGMTINLFFGQLL